MNIFIGNLAKEVNETDLSDLFSQYGIVKSVKVIKDLFTGESKGFAFVEMPGTREAEKAISELNTVDLKGKKLVVNEARPKNTMGGNKRGGFRGNSGNNTRRRF